MTFKHITINRIPVDRDTVVRQAYNRAVQREERLAQNADALFRALHRANVWMRERHAVLGLPCPEWVNEARDALNAATGES